MMNFEDFIVAVEEQILSVLPETGAKLDVCIQDVKKNNNVILKGLIIRKANEQITPTIYLEHFYEMYEYTKDFEEVLDSIATAYQNSCNKRLPGFDISILTEDKVIGQLVRTEGNDNLLRDIPSVQILNGKFSVIFRYRLSVGGDNASILITDSIAEMKGLTVDRLYELACYNTSEYQKMELLPIEDVLAGMMGMDKPMGFGLNLYVLGNASRYYGAFMVLRPDVQQELMNRFDGDLIVIPSSVHELLLIPANEADESMVAGLNMMIQTVNDTEVSPEEVLGDEYFVLQRTENGYELAEK